MGVGEGVGEREENGYRLLMLNLLSVRHGARWHLSKQEEDEGEGGR